MTVDEEGATAARPDWTPLASVMSNPGEGNCLFHALSQLDLGGKARSHRQLRLCPLRAQTVVGLRGDAQHSW